MNTQIENLFDRDIYYVEETHNGEKQLNIQRYYYDDEHINIVEYTGIRLPIPSDRETVDDAIMDSKQYSGVVSLNREKALKVMEDDIANATPLPIDEVNENTPCGMYIDFKN